MRKDLLIPMERIEQATEQIKEGDPLPVEMKSIRYMKEYRRRP